MPIAPARPKRKGASTRRCASIAAPPSSTRRTGRSAAKASELEQIIRDRLEAARPRPQIERLREEAQRATPEPLLSPTTPLGPVRFNNANARDVLNFIGADHRHQRHLRSRLSSIGTISIDVEGVTLEQALQQIMLTNQMFYKVLNERTILVIQDNDAKRDAVRGSGRAHVLPVARRCHRDAAAADRHHPRAPAWRFSRSSSPNKTTQHADRARLDGGDGDHRADARGESTSRAPKSSSTCRSSRSAASGPSSTG